VNTSVRTGLHRLLWLVVSWLALAVPASAATWQLNAPAGREQLDIRLDPDIREESVFRSGPTSVDIRFNAPAGGIARQGGEPASGLIARVEAADATLRLHMRDPAFGYIVQRREGGLTLEVFADQLGMRWRPDDTRVLPPTPARPEPESGPTAEAAAPQPPPPRADSPASAPDPGQPPSGQPPAGPAQATAGQSPSAQTPVQTPVQTPSQTPVQAPGQAEPARPPSVPAAPPTAASPAASTSPDAASPANAPAPAVSGTPGPGASASGTGAAGASAPGVPSAIIAVPVAPAQTPAPQPAQNAAGSDSVAGGQAAMPQGMPGPGGGGRIAVISGERLPVQEDPPTAGIPSKEALDAIAQTIESRPEIWAPPPPPPPTK
jgi:hypothetical protein